jgi:hypothetical protein
MSFQCRNHSSPVFILKDQTHPHTRDSIVLPDGPLGSPTLCNATFADFVPTPDATDGAGGAGGAGSGPTSYVYHSGPIEQWPDLAADVEPHSLLQ